MRHRCCYIIDNSGLSTETLKDFDYLNKTDRIEIFTNLTNVNKYMGNILDNKEIKDNFIIHNITTLVEDVIDFNIVPYVTEIAYKHLYDKIIIISNNPRFNCLVNYIKENVNENIYKAPSIKYFYISEYISKLLDTSIEKGLSILNDLIIFKEFSLDIFDDCDKLNAFRNTEKFECIINEFDLSDFEYFIDSKHLEKYNSFIETYFSDEEDNISKVEYYLKKSDSYKKFRERILSSNQIFENKKSKETFLNSFLDTCRTDIMIA